MPWVFSPSLIALFTPLAPHAAKEGINKAAALLVWGAPEPFPHTAVLCCSHLYLVPARHPR